MKIAVYNNKGGVGKTSLVAHVGFRAIQLKKHITVLDADRQSNAMDWLSNGQWDGNSLLEIGTVKLTTDIMEVDNSDITITDCPPAFEVVELYQDVDIWIVPVSGRFSVSGAMNVLDSIKKVDKKPRVVLVANMVDARTEFGKKELEEIRKLDVELFKLPIPRHDVVGKAEMSCVPCWDIPYGIRSLTAVNLRTFADWVLSGCNERGVYNG
jgi:cellulose biosynthesis protein BcsQ